MMQEAQGGGARTGPLDTTRSDPVAAQEDSGVVLGAEDAPSRTSGRHESALPELEAKQQSTERRLVALRDDYARAQRRASATAVSVFSSAAQAMLVSAARSSASPTAAASPPTDESSRGQGGDDDVDDGFWAADAARDDSGDTHYRTHLEMQPLSLIHI